MTTRDRLTVAAALAVVLACAALAPVYEGLGWLVRVLGSVLVVAAAAALARLAGAPRPLQPLAGLTGLALYVPLVFAPDTLAFGLLPTTQSLRALGATLGQGLLDVEQTSTPVPTRPGLVLLAVLGAGGIAVLVDTLAVVLRKVAAAGLPLLVLFAVPSAVVPGGLGVLPFLLGAAGWLGLLLADGSDRVARWGTPLRAGRTSLSDPSLGRVGRRIGAAALGVAVVVPALVPGLDGRLLTGSGDGAGSGGARTTTTYNPILSLAGQLRRPSPQTLLTYRTDADPDYLRLTTLDRFDEDRGWSSSELSGDLDDDAVQDGIPAPLGRTLPTERQEFEIELRRQLDGPWLPAPALPEDIEVEGAWLWDAEAQTAFSTRTTLREVDEPYLVRTVRTTPDPAALRRPQSVPAEIREDYAVPPRLSRFARDLLARTTRDAVTPYDKVLALQALFQGPDFVYSEETSVPPTNSPDALTSFLRTKRGFCEQYASAMGALVRGLGIPARVAVGFTVGSRLEDGRYRVTTDEAHAWPEVWFEGAGWVRFEPTPRDGRVSLPPYSVPPVQQDSAAEATPSAAPAAPETSPGADPGQLNRADEGEAPTGTTGGDTGTRLSPLLLLVPAGLLLLAAPALLAAARRRRRWRAPEPLTAWATVQDDAVDVGHRWRPTDSPRAAAAHLLSVRRLPADAADALQRLAVAAERARYARPGAPGEASGLHRDATTVRRALLAGATPRGRWRARLAPPSTLRWASAATGTATADLLDRFDAAVTAVGARVRHPRAARRAG